MAPTLYTVNNKSKLGLQLLHTLSCHGGVKFEDIFYTWIYFIVMSK